MSTYETYYNNLTTDLTSVLPDLERYDQKKLAVNWIVDSGSVYRSDSIGYVSQLYRNSKNLGAAESLKSDLTENYEWFADTANDVVYVYSSTDPNEDTYEAGEDWVTLKTRKAQEAAEQIRSFIPFPILPRKGVGTASGSSRDWDWIVIKANALLAVAGLIANQDAELAASFEKKAIDAEDGLGLLDQLVAGRYHLWNQGEHQNQMRRVSINGSTTGDIVDVKGTSGIDWDILKIVIDSGGTLTAGSASSITYSTYGKNDTGLKIAQIINGETLTGGWNQAGYNMWFRASAGVHTTSDEYEMEVSNMTDNAEIKTARIYR